MNIVMVLAPEGFQDQEYADPRAVLESAGHTVKTASLAKEAVGKFGSRVSGDYLLNDIEASAFEAVVFVGGPGTPIYFENPTALALAKTFWQAGKITAAICAAPGILAKADLIRGKHVTSWPGATPLLEAAGGIPTGASVEEDGNLITADGPSSAKAFGERIALRLQSHA